MIRNVIFLKNDNIIINKKLGGIPYTAHGAQITHPSPLFFIFVFYSRFHAYFRIGWVKYEFLNAPQG